MARKCKCGCRTEIKPAAKCTTYMEKLGFATEECQQKAAMAALDKLRAKNERKAKADKTKAEKADRAKHRDDLKRVRANPRKDALEAAQLLSRVSAADDNGYCTCVTCGVVQKWNEMDGGHFIAKGSSSYWMLDPRNIQPQCKPCNGFAMKHGHAAIAYTSWMIEEYGKEFVDEMISKVKTKTKRSAQFFKDYTDQAKIEITKHKKRIGAHL